MENIAAGKRPRNVQLVFQAQLRCSQTLDFLLGLLTILLICILSAAFYVAVCITIIRYTGMCSLIREFSPVLKGMIS